MDILLSILGVAKWRGNFDAEGFWMYLCARAMFASTICLALCVVLLFSPLDMLGSGVGLIGLSLFTLSYVFSAISEYRR